MCRFEFRSGTVPRCHDGSNMKMNMTLEAATVQPPTHENRAATLRPMLAGFEANSRSSAAFFLSSRRMSRFRTQPNSSRSVGGMGVSS